MSSFFTLPASQRKRKRDDRATAPASKKRGVSGNVNGGEKKGKGRREREESISESELDDDEELSSSAESAASAASEESEPESDEGETAADKRLKLAERYLENIREEVDEVGFDAAEIDRDLIAERLKEDVVRLPSHSEQREYNSPYIRMSSKDVCSGKLEHNCLFLPHRTLSSAQTLRPLLLSLSTRLTFIRCQKTRR